MATPKQEKLIKLLMANYGKKGETKTLGQLLLDAGYSKESAHNPKLILDSEVIKDGVQDFIKQLNDKRKRAITHITDKKLKEASPRDLTYITDLFTKNIQLLSGGNTDKSEMKISWEE